MIKELGGEELAHQVIVVVAGIEGDVDLGGPVGFVAPGGHLQQLVFFHEFPPAAVQVLAGVLVHALFETEHHLGPAAEDHLLQAQGLAHGPGDAFAFGGADARHGAQPGRRRGEAPEEVGHGLGGERMGGVAQGPGQRAVVELGVDRVAELVQQRVHPVGIGLDAAQDAHVAGAVDVAGKSVLVLARLFEQVAALDDVVDVQAHAVEVRFGQGDQVLVLVIGVEVHRVDDRRLLEEAVLVVPGLELLFGDAAARGQEGVDVVFQGGEAAAGQFVQFIEKGFDLLRVLLAQLQLHLLEIGESQLPGGGVAQAHQLQDVGGDQAADLLARFPDFFQLAGVGRGAQDVFGVVVAQHLVVHAGCGRC